MGGPNQGTRALGSRGRKAASISARPVCHQASKAGPESVRPVANWCATRFWRGWDTSSVVKRSGVATATRRRPIRPAQVTDLIAHQPSWSGCWGIPPRLVEASQESVEHVVLRLQVRTKGVHVHAGCSSWDGARCCHANIEPRNRP
jgi:hypothetical protein